MIAPDRPAPVPTQRRAPDSSAPTAAVVVAVDGSEASVRALVWALEHASAQGWTVEILTTWPLHGPVFLHEVSGHFSEARWLAREAQAEAAARALGSVSAAARCDLRLVNARLVDALVDRVTTTAPALLVLGSDTTEPPDARRLPGQVLRAVPGPVVVVGPDGPVERTTGRPTGRRRTRPAREPAARAPKHT